MDAQSITIAKIFHNGGDIHYVLPHFQREYSWEKTHWRTLLDDALGMYDEIPDNEDKNAAVNVEHFLGSIVVIPDGFRNGTISALKLVDGQQRLTSISLLLKAFAAALGPSHAITPKIERHLLNLAETDSVYFKLLPTSKYGDRDSYCAIMRGDALPESVSRIPAAFEFFKSELAARLADGLKPEKFLIVLLNVFRVVFITLNPNESPYRIFESLNAKGKPLTPADLIRNYVAMRLPSSLQEKVFKESWSTIEARLQESEKVGRLGELTAFIRHYLAMRTGVLCEEGHVYARFRDRSEHQFDGPAAFEEELKTLARFSGYYDLLRRPHRIKEPDLKAGVERLNTLDGIATYPILLHLFEARFRGELNLGQVCEAVSTFENYLMRRHVAGEPSSYLNRMFAALWSEVSLSAFTESLRAAIVKKRYPTNRKLFQAAESGELYSNNQFVRRRTGLLLESINRHLSQGTGGYTVLDGAAQIEHVLPQSPNDGWKEDLGVQWEQIHRDYVHTLGNLTLVTGEWNITLSNADFSHKKPLLGGHALTLNNSWFSRDTIKKWGRAEIEDRAKELCSIIVKLWPPLMPEEQLADEDRSEISEFTEKSAECVAVKLNKPLRRVGTSRFSSHDKGTKVVGMASKNYGSTGEADSSYWFGFSASQRVFLQDCPDSWVAFSCGAPDKLLLASYETFGPLLQSLNQTEDVHWYVFLNERNGRFFLTLSREGVKMDVTEWRVNGQS